MHSPNSPQTPSKDNKREVLPDRYIEQIFARMAAAFGHKFASQFGSAKALKIAKQEWSNALAPLTDEQIARGLNAARDLLNWSPTTSEFIRMACDLPTLETTIARILSKQNIDEISYRISAIIGSYALRNCSERDLITRIRGHYPDVYKIVLAKTMGNDERFTPVAGIEKEQDQEVTEFKYGDPQVAEAEVSKIRSILCGMEADMEALS